MEKILTPQNKKKMKEATKATKQWIKQNKKPIIIGTIIAGAYLLGYLIGNKRKKKETKKGNE